MKSHALRTGDMRLSAIGEDVVLVELSIRGGKDVFGKAAANEHRAVAVNRSGESRWIEYGGKIVEIAGESALILK